MQSLVIFAALLIAFSAQAAPGQFVNLLGTQGTAPIADEVNAGDPRIERLVGAPDDVWERIRRGFAMPDLAGRRVTSSEEWYAARPELVQSILSRARRYLYYLVEEVERRGMPAEIALLPLVESGFNPKAVSDAQAAGLWQFIPATGSRYGLAQDPHYDARRDVVSSTAAALDYLQFLHATYRDWALALAAYNWGEQSLTRAIELSRARGQDGSFATLSLPEETRNYVPRLQAVKNLVAEPGRFGIELGQLPNEPYFTVIRTQTPLSLAAAASFAGISLDELVLLNPGLSTTHIAGRQGISLVLPVESAAEFRSNYARWLKSRPSARSTSRSVRQ